MRLRNSSAVMPARQSSASCRRSIALGLFPGDEFVSGYFSLGVPGRVTQRRADEFVKGNFEFMPRAALAVALRIPRSLAGFDNRKHGRPSS